MSSSIEPNLIKLIVEYDLTKFIEKFENEGITSYRHVKGIDQTRLRSYYHMLGVDLGNFEKLRDECIQISEQSCTPEITHTKPESIVNEMRTIRAEHPPSSLMPNSQPIIGQLPPLQRYAPMPETRARGQSQSLPTYMNPPNDNPPPIYLQDQYLTMGNHFDSFVSMMPQQLHTFQPAQTVYYPSQPQTFGYRYPTSFENQPQTMVNFEQAPYSVSVTNNYIQHPYLVFQGQYTDSRLRPAYTSPAPNPQPPYNSIITGAIPPQQFPERQPRTEKASLPTTPSTNPSLSSTHYSVGHSKGLGLIFTNMKHDEENFVEIFQMMGLEYQKFFDFTTEQITRKLEEISKKDFNQYPMLCVGFSTRGGQGDLLCGKDGTKFSLYNQVVSLFKPDKCPNLGGKPKVFLVQACRGESREGGIRADSIEAHIPHTLESDFLIAHSTVSGHQAYRHVNTGSWFISQLKNAILTHRKKYNFLDILTFVNQFIVNTSTQNKEYSQTCQIESTLTRILKIDPKQATP